MLAAIFIAFCLGFLHVILFCWLGRLDIRPWHKSCWFLGMGTGYKISGFGFFFSFSPPNPSPMSVNWGCFWLFSGLCFLSVLFPLRAFLGRCSSRYPLIKWGMPKFSWLLEWLFFFEFACHNIFCFSWDISTRERGTGRRMDSKNFALLKKKKKKLVQMGCDWTHLTRFYYLDGWNWIIWKFSHIL